MQITVKHNIYAEHSSFHDKINFKFEVWIYNQGFQKVSAKIKVAFSRNWTYNTGHHWFWSLMLIQLCQLDMRMGDLSL